MSQSLTSETVLGEAMSGGLSLDRSMESERVGWLLKLALCPA